MDAASHELIEAALALTDELLGVELDEAGKSYYYEETLMKRVLPGESASGTCACCDENIAAGWIDSEDVYPDGSDGPPFHPNCVCSEDYKTSRKRVYV
jgi:hypothetical protein